MFFREFSQKPLQRLYEYSCRVEALDLRRILQTYLVNFLLDELVLLAACELLTAVRVRHLELVALLLGDAELRLRLPGFGLIGLVGLHRRVQLVQHPEYLLVRLVADLATLRQETPKEI